MKLNKNASQLALVLSSFAYIFQWSADGRTKGPFLCNSVVYFYSVKLLAAQTVLSLGSSLLLVHCFQLSLYLRWNEFLYMCTAVNSDIPLFMINVHQKLLKIILYILAVATISHKTLNLRLVIQKGVVLTTRPDSPFWKWRGSHFLYSHIQKLIWQLLLLTCLPVYEQIFVLIQWFNRMAKNQPILCSYKIELFRGTILGV